MKNKGILIGIFVMDAILIGVCAFLYLRQDRTVPVISFEENDIIYSDSIDPALLLEGVTAYDSQDGDVTDSLTIEKISDTSDGNVIITYAALDGANNVGKATRVLQAQLDSGREETVKTQEENQ